MKFPIRTIAGVTVTMSLIAGCGSSESDTSVDRDRNVDVAVVNAKFGPNESGIAVTPLKTTRYQYIATQSYKRQSAEPVVYGAITLRTQEENGREASTAELKIVRIIGGGDKLVFDPTYNVKTLSGAETIAASTEVVVTQNRTVLLLDRQQDEMGNESVVVRRYMLATGKPDSTFGNKGQLTIDPTAAGVSGQVRFVVEGVDGSLFVGVSQIDITPTVNHVIKYKGDGLRDASFGNQGVAGVPAVGPNGGVDLLMRGAHVVWENDQKGTLVIAATMSTGYDGYDYSIPFRMSATGVVNAAELSDAYTSRVWRVVAGHDVGIAIDAMMPDNLKDKSVDIAPEELVTRILIGGTMPHMGSPYTIYKSWIALNGFPGNRSATVAPYRFSDPDKNFASDETLLGRMSQFSINGVMAHVGAVTSRGANFQGLALMTSAPLNEQLAGPLTSNIRLADYPSTRLTPTRLRVGTNGELYFSQRAFGRLTSSGAIKDSIVQKVWGVALDANGLPPDGMTTPVFESPINNAVATSRTAGVDNQTESVVTIFDESGGVHALFPVEDGLAVEALTEGGALTRKGTPLKMPAQWGTPAMPSSPDAVVIRDGELWIAGVYTSTVAETLGMPVFGVAKFDLATGEADATYGDGGVSVIGTAQVASFSSRPLDLVVNPDGSSAAINFADNTPDTKVFVLRNPIGGNRNIDLQKLSTSMKPILVTIPADVLTRDSITTGPIGFTADASGNIVAAQVRRELAYITSATKRDAKFTVRIWRFGPNAQLDEAFDGGYVEHDITGSVDVQPFMDTVPQVAVQADGKILVGLNGLRSIDTLVVDAATVPVREDVHVLARFTTVGQFDAIKVPAPKPVIAPVRVDVLPPAPTQAEERTAVENPFTGGSGLAETVVTIPEVKLPDVKLPEVAAASPAASGTLNPPRLQILTAVSTLDRSIGVKWAIPASLAKANVTYEVTAVPGGKTCTTTSTLCVFRGLEPWTAYSFTVAVKSGAEGVASSDPSPPAKPLRILARKKTLKTTDLITPAAKGKLTWKVTGACRLSKDAATLTLPSDATTCALSVRSPKSGKTPATTRSITIDVRAIVK